jgi:hypothetical protein
MKYDPGPENKPKPDKDPDNVDWESDTADDWDKITSIDYEYDGDDEDFDEDDEYFDEEYDEEYDEEEDYYDNLDKEPN